MTIERPMFPPAVTADIINFSQEPPAPICADKLNRDLAFCRLESRICDLDRLSEIAVNLSHQALACPDSSRPGELAVTILEIVQDRIAELRATYFRWYKNPPGDDDDDSYPSYVQPVSDQRE